MTEQKPVTILMAVYNGEKYLKDQIESILGQSYHNWQLVVRDDQSSDTTTSILRYYIQKDSRINLINYGTLHGSACQNFSELTSWALVHTDSYIMYADQDDIWATDKIEVSVTELTAMENRCGAGMPILCYSNFQFIDEKGTAINTHLRLPEKLKLSVLLNENHAWGCTMILNRALLELVIPIPSDAVNHDYWIALVASALGETKLIHAALIQYRQHALNVSGNVDNMSITQRFKRYVADRRYMLEPLAANFRTVLYLYQRHSSLLKTTDKRMLNSFISSYYKGFIPLLSTLLRYRIFKIGIAKNAAYWYTLLLLRKQVMENYKINPIHEDSL
jgi:glycosyltransferase involved in cell wall biosynthesis